MHVGTFVFVRLKAFTATDTDSLDFQLRHRLEGGAVRRVHHPARLPARKVRQAVRMRVRGGLGRPTLRLPHVQAG